MKYLVVITLIIFVANKLPYLYYSLAVSFNRDFLIAHLSLFERVDGISFLVLISAMIATGVLMVALRKTLSPDHRVLLSIWGIIWIGYSILYLLLVYRIGISPTLTSGNAIAFSLWIDLLLPTIQFLAVGIGIPVYMLATGRFGHRRFLWVAILVMGVSWVFTGLYNAYNLLVFSTFPPTPAAYRYNFLLLQYGPINSLLLGALLEFIFALLYAVAVVWFKSDLRPPPASGVHEANDNGKHIEDEDVTVVFER